MTVSVSVPAQDGIVVLGKAHTLSVRSLNGLPGRAGVPGMKTRFPSLRPPSQYTDTGPNSPSDGPITPGAWQGSHLSANF